MSDRASVPRSLLVLEADRAAAPVDPKLLTEREKDAKILALQARVEMLETICLLDYQDLQAIERVVGEAAHVPSAIRTLVVALCRRRWERAMEVTSAIVSDPETGVETFMRRSL